MNRYGIPAAAERAIRERYAHCVYCRKRMAQMRDGGPRGDCATLEHLNYMPPWDDPSTVVMCCWSCNSSRGNKPLLAWFRTSYCKARNISLATVPSEVRAYVQQHEGLA